MGDLGFSYFNQGIGVLLIDLLLSGDNAILIAMACRNLPATQRRQAMWIGIAGAFLLRLLITSAASMTLMLPLIHMVGGALLVWIAIQLLTEEQRAPGDGSSIEVGARFDAPLARAIKTIITADAIMSLDNVLALAAYAHDNLTVLGLGLLLSMPILMLSSVYLSTLLEEARYIAWVGGAFLGWIAGDLLVGESLFREWVEVQSPGLKFAVPLIGAVYVVWQSRIILNSKSRITRPPTPFLAGLAPRPPKRGVAVSIRDADQGLGSTPALMTELIAEDSPAAASEAIPVQRLSTATESMPRAPGAIVPTPTHAGSSSIKLWALGGLAAVFVSGLLFLFATVLFGHDWMPKPDDAVAYQCLNPLAQISISANSGRVAISTATGYSRGQTKGKNIDWDNYRASGKAIGFPPPTDIVEFGPDRLVVHGGMFVNAVCNKSATKKG